MLELRGTQNGVLWLQRQPFSAGAADFPKTWLIHRNSPVRYLDRTLGPEISPDFDQDMPEINNEGIRRALYINKYIKWRGCSISRHRQS